MLPLLNSMVTINALQCTSTIPEAKEYWKMVIKTSNIFKANSIKTLGCKLPNLWDISAFSLTNFTGDYYAVTISSLSSLIPWFFTFLVRDSLCLLPRKLSYFVLPFPYLRSFLCLHLRFELTLGLINCTIFSNQM